MKIEFIREGELFILAQSTQGGWVLEKGDEKKAGIALSVAKVDLSGMYFPGNQEEAAAIAEKLGGTLTGTKKKNPGMPGTVF